MTAPAVTAPHTSRPRRASAGTRRGHLRRLPWRIQQLLPGAQRILVVPVAWSTDREGRPTARYTLEAHDAAGRRIPHDTDTIARVVSLLQGAHPTANWTVAQTWTASSGQLTEWRPHTLHPTRRTA